MRVAVIGGSGFVGRHVARELIRGSHGVVNVDLAPPKAVLPGEEIRIADLLSEGGAENLANDLSGIDGVVWAAAIIRQRHGVDATAGEDLRLMVDAPLRFLIALAPSPAAFVNISSVQVYGRPVRLPVDEEHPKDPFTAYGVAKLCAEQMLEIAGMKRNASMASLRLAFVYGPGQHPANVLPRFLEAVAKGERPLVHGSGADVRDDVYVGDVARAVRLALERRAHGAFNVASGAPHTLLDVARAACTVGPAGMTPRHDDEPSRWIDRWYATARARDAFGFSAETRFTEGVRAMWDERTGA